MTAIHSYAVLYIDDHCEGYLRSIEPAAKCAGIDLYAVDNVLEGLEFLNEYSETIQAVILDLTFPKGEMQGKEALQKIKTRYSSLPVIILTDSDTSADIEKVVECMQKGAYNYVGKRTLNPFYLFQVVQTAIDHSLLQISVTHRADTFYKKENFFTIRKEFPYGQFTKSAVFGFELCFVNKPGNDLEADTLRSEALIWHQNLLKTISVIYRDEVQLNLKYIASNAAIRFYLLVTLYATDDKSLELLITRS